MTARGQGSNEFCARVAGISYPFKEIIGFHVDNLDEKLYQVIWEDGSSSWCAKDDFDDLNDLADVKEAFVIEKWARNYDDTVTVWWVGYIEPTTEPAASVAHAHAFEC